MRRLALLIVGGAVWLLLAAPAFADNGPHHKGAGTTPDSCAGCHRAHTAQGAKLLVDPSQTGLCLTCHGNGGGGATTNVQGGQQYMASGNLTTPGAVETVVRGTTVAGPLRGGGFDTAAIGSGAVVAGDPGAGTVGVLGTPIATTSKHDVDGVARTAWGRGDISAIANAGTSVTLTCGSCHDPHGNGQYRILKPTPEGAYSGAYAGPPTVAAMSNIAIADGTAWTYTTTNYWAPADATATEYNTKVSSWCASCHTRYLAGSGAGSTSSTDAVFNYRHRTNGSTGTTACVVCHVSHGSNAAMGTNSQAVPLPGATLGRGTDSSLLRVDNRGVCQQCHTK